MVYRKRIAEMMERRGLSQRGLSLKIGRNPSFIRDFFRNDDQSPSIDSVIDIAAVLDCTVGYLIGETGNTTCDVVYLDTEDRSGEAV